MNLFSAEEIAEGNADMNNVFDSFARELPVRFYKTAKQVVVVDPNYSSDYDAEFNKNLKTAQYQDIICIVLYLEREPVKTLIGGNEENLRGEFVYNRIKIHFKPEYLTFFKGTHRFVFDGIEYKLEGAARGLGLFGTFNCYEIILQKVN